VVKAPGHSRPQPGLVLLLGWIFWWAPAGAQDPAPVGSGTGPVAEEVSEALEDLDEAGVPPSAEESAAFVRELARGRPPRIGEVTLRHGYRPDRDHHGTVGVTLGRGSWYVRGRGRFEPQGLVTRAAVAGWEHRVVTLRAGFLGFRHGFGLLISPPGRSATLGADQSLGPGSARFAGWIGTADKRTWFGVGVGLALGRWRLFSMAGREPPGQVTVGREAGFLRLALAGKSGQLAAAVLSTTSGRGVSLIGTLVGSRHRGGIEGTVWQDPNGAHDGWAGVAQAAWRPARRHMVEALWVAADRQDDWSAGRRPPVLLDWSGHGYALRMRTSPGPGISVRGMWHQGWSLPGAGPDEKTRRRVTELQWHQDLTGPWALALRYRRTSKTDWEWSRRHPWLPAVPRTSDLKTVVSMKLTCDRKTWRVGVRLRSLIRESPVGPGRRNLLAANWRAHPHPRWIVRFFASTAWGDNVDLVSAIVPIAGLVLSRHWGKWRSETGLGLEHTGASWSIRSACGVRRPEPASGEVLDPWLRTAVDWRW